ncbi:Secreted trypsin-like serine protease [Minicystis rosea]|nr:Secreted trypsin-like serine protease [Minicystis rosea]
MTMQQATHITLRDAALRDPRENPLRPGAAPTGAPLPEPPHRGIFRAVQTAAALAIVAVAGLVGTTSSVGCGSDEFCVGGFVREAPNGDNPGVCEGKCSASACGASNVCVDNHCALTCTSHLDCNPLTQDCAPAKEDDSKKDVATCQSTGKGTIGIKCPFGIECKRTYICPDGQACDPKAATNPCAAADCKVAAPGAYACPDGKACDPDCTGSDCACAADQCKELTCRTSGVGDTDAFCTMKDCHDDGECPGGFYCAKIRDPHEICGTDKGNSDFCGTTTEPCVDPAQNATTGATYTEGTFCAVRNECRPRKQCAPCETDLDCSLNAGQHCTTMPKDGTKSCTRDCTTDADCEGSFTCTNGACIPRFGTCVGGGNYCEPCRNDLDCTGNNACVSYGGSERMCIDVSASQACTSDNDCPTGPDGRHMLCGDEDLGLATNDPRYHKCVIPPLNEGAGRVSCWCSNPGTACYKKEDCCSGKCIGAVVSAMIPGECKP